MLLTIVLVLAGGLSLWWGVSYLREGDAGDATGRTIRGFGSLLLGSFAIGSIVLSEFATLLASIGDMLGMHAPYVAHAVGIVLGYLSLGGRLEITPGTWIIVMVAVLVVLIMFDRGS